jgi:hypothetical protein
MMRCDRPELVKNNDVPLCSDAYSTFHIENAAQFEADIARATQRLEQEIIPAFAAVLDQHYKDQPIDELSLREEFPKLVIAIHRKGINVRYLGLLRSHCSVHSLKAFILTEIIARVHYIQ